jgi:hypothetical protein
MSRAFDTVKMKRSNGVMIFPLFLCVMVCLMVQLGAANVVLMGTNLTLSFDDTEASFGKLWTTYGRLALSDYQLLLDSISCEICFFASMPLPICLINALLVAPAYC